MQNFKLFFILFFSFFLFRFSAYANLNKVNKVKEDTFHNIYTPPKLIIGIVVDQMRFEYIQKFWNLFSQKGFKQLVDKGFFFRNHHYDYIPTVTAAGHATIATGAYPSEHGIVGNAFYSRKESQVLSCVKDESVKTIGSNSTKGQASPHLLHSNTFSDQMKIFFNKRNKSYSISLKDRSAILSLGYEGNAAYWFDLKNLSWVSSSFYCQTLPLWLQKINDNLSQILYKNPEWLTLLPSHKYSFASKNNYSKKGNHFLIKNIFDSLNSSETLENLYVSPLGNDILLELALSLIENEKLGKSDKVDFLNISFSSTDAIGHKYGPQSLEVADCYARLDLSIAKLLHFLDKEIGQENYLIYLTADHGVGELPEYTSTLQIAKTNKSIQNIDSIINLFFAPFTISSNGEKLLESYYGSHIFLNKKYLNHHPSHSYKYYSDSLESYLRQKGIYSLSVLNIKDINNEPLSQNFIHIIKNSIHYDRSGDLWIITKPHSIFSKDEQASHFTFYNYDTHVPLIWYGKNIKKGMSTEKTSPVDIAPTISSMLGISAPPHSKGKILDIFLHTN